VAMVYCRNSKMNPARQIFTFTSVDLATMGLLDIASCPKRTNNWKIQVQHDIVFISILINFC